MEAGEENVDGQCAENRPEVQPRILSLELQTAAPLARMKEFYHETLGLSVIEDRTERGDEHGLVLVMRRGRVISFDSPERKAVDVFRTAARIRGNRSIRHRIADFPYELTVQA